MGYERHSRSFSNAKPSTDFVIRKFFREVQQSRILSEAKKKRFFSKDINRTEKRAIARRKTIIRKIKRGY
jgi:ribosomal protein S21